MLQTRYQNSDIRDKLSYLCFISLHFISSMSSIPCVLDWAKPVTTNATKHDRECTEKRVAFFQRGNRYHWMEVALAQLTKVRLLGDAVLFVRAHPGIPMPDRLARRERRALICWFCAYWPERMSSGLLQTGTNSRWDVVWQPEALQRIDLDDSVGQFDDDDIEWDIDLFHDWAY
jgi:hypothetical protein